MKNRKLSSRLATAPTGASVDLTWGAGGPEVFDKACNPIGLSVLKVGDTITMGYDTTNKMVDAIQRTSD
jgi:hypothetical protein